MLSPSYDLDRFFEALQDKAWIEILRATQDEMHSLRKADSPSAAYLAPLKEFQAYLLKPTDPLPEEYKALVRRMRVTQDRDKAKAAAAK